MLDSKLGTARHGAALLVIALIAATAGCSGGSAPDGGKSSEAAKASASGASSDACAIFAQKEIADLAGNPVLPGKPFAGPEVCKWDTEDPDHVSVLLTVRPKGSVRETTLCADLKKGGEGGVRLEGLGDIAVWKFSKTGSLFNSGDLDACGGKGYVSVSLNGKRDEAALRQAGVAIVRKALLRP